MSTHRRRGRRRTITDEQVRAVRAWKPLKALAQELGISYKVARFARGYHYKTPSP